MSIDLQKNDPISTFGSDNVFIALYYSRKGELIELTAQFVQYFPQTGRYLTEEVGREVTTDEEDALSFACDLEHQGGRIDNEINCSC